MSIWKTWFSGHCNKRNASYDIKNKIKDNWSQWNESVFLLFNYFTVYTINLAGMGMVTDENGWGQMQQGRIGMEKNTMGTVGDGDNWKLRGWEWGQLGVPMSLSNPINIVQKCFSNPINIVQICFISKTFMCSNNCIKIKFASINLKCKYTTCLVKEKYRSDKHRPWLLLMITWTHKNFNYPLM